MQIDQLLEEYLAVAIQLHSGGPRDRSHAINAEQVLTKRAEVLAAIRDLVRREVDRAVSAASGDWQFFDEHGRPVEALPSPTFAVEDTRARLDALRDQIAAARVRLASNRHGPFAT